MSQNKTPKRARTFWKFSALTAAFLLTACGGGGGGGDGGGVTTLGIGGGGVKGPLANAIVTAYAFDTTKAGFKGAVIDTGSTGTDAKITGLNLALPLTPPYILEFTSDAGTTDITTGKAPVITIMRTVLTQALLDTGEDVYATPLTTMATDLAVANADSVTAPFMGNGNGTTTLAEFVAALPVAALQVTSTLGFGLDSSVDIFDTPPLVDSTTATVTEQAKVAAYRAAVEAVTAVVYEMNQQSTGTTPDAVLAEITSDLAKDGLIDGNTEAGVSTILTTATLAVLTQNPALLKIPNTDDGTGTEILVGAVEQLLNDEKSTTGSTINTDALTNGTIDTVIASAETNPDIDGDGTLNAADAFPTDATESVDSDSDGVGDNADAFPTDATETADSDGDTIGDNAETAAGTDPNSADSDSDGVNDNIDVFPLNAGETVDSDSDGVGDNADAFPLDATETADSDGDTLGDNAETAAGTDPNSADSDSDGVNDNIDVFPLNAGETVDSDGDGVGDNADAFPLDATETADSDGDTIGDNAETAAGTNPNSADSDGDGANDNIDAFPLDVTETTDNDSDGVGNNGDNCPMVANSDQADSDGDGTGDACQTTSALDATGVWNAAVTVTSLSPFVTNGCAENDPVSTVNNMYLTMTQSGTTLTAKTVWGDSLSGSIDAAGAFTLNGVTTRTDPSSGGVDTDTISVTGTLSSATAWTGTATVTEAFTPAGGTLANQCTETSNLSSAFVYKHVASEDYSGVYGLEAMQDDQRKTFALEFETAGSNLRLNVNNNDIGTAFFDSYDPVTGFFSNSTVDTRDFGDGTSETWTDNITGIFVRAPGDGSGPQVSIVVDSYGERFSGWGGTGTSLGVESMEIEGYGKQVNTQLIARSMHYRPNNGGGDRDDVFMGLIHPPLKGDNTNQYVEVLDTDGSTRLCARSFEQRYREFQYLPAVDMSTEQFQSKAYSAVTCNTFDTGIRVMDGMNYIVRIRDMGTDATIDNATSGGDDTTLFSQSLTAVLHPSVFTEKPTANDFALNGAAAPATMKRGDKNGAINLFGFFDVNDDMVFGWTNLTGADLHQIQFKNVSDEPEERVRIEATAPTAMATIPAGTLDSLNVTEIRLRAIKTDAGNGAVALSNSKWLLVSPGIKGLFNVELGNAVDPAHASFQLWMMAGMGDDMTATISDCQNTSPNWTCNGGTINYTSNTISLSMTDDTGSLGTVTLDLAFTDSASATVSSTSAGLSLIPAQTHVRLVNPGLLVRSLQPSGGVAQQSLVVLRNVIGGGDLSAGGIFDKAVFKRNDNANFLINGGTDAGVNARVTWCEASGGCGITKPFMNFVSAFQKRPIDDGLAQGAGNFMSDRSNSDWGLGFGLLDGSAGGVTYKSVWINSTNSNVKWVFKTDYAAPDASVLVTPLHNQVTVNLTGGNVAAATGVGESASPINISSQPAFGLTWAGSVPAGGEWQIRITYIAGTEPFYPGAEVRSVWMTAAHPDLADNGDGTWTWNNGEGIALKSGDKVNVQIRARDGAAFTMLGAQRTGTTDDRLYLTMP